MIVITVLYPKTAESRFDHAYYLEHHIPFVRSRWEPLGLQTVELVRGLTSLDGSAPSYELIGQLSFRDPESVQAALAAHGAEIVADIQNFTDVQPSIQMNESIRVD